MADLTPEQTKAPAAPPKGGAAPASSLLGRKAQILAGLRDWEPFIDATKLDAALAGIDAAGDGGRTAPAPHLILEALRYGPPAAYTVVMNAQDPYPTPGEAQGLCFSVPGGKALPESLKRVFGCLDRAGLRREHLDEGQKRYVVSGDLRPWAAQGVLMLNSALTTRIGARRAHADLWKPFVDEFLRRFCEFHQREGRQLLFLLWGGDARAYSPLARRFKHRALEWSHPSPMADNRLPDEAKFRACTHFEDVNAALVGTGRRPIVWDNLAPVIGFTDGSCDLVGKKDVVATLTTRASYSALVTGGPFGATIVRGEVAPYEYRFANPGDPRDGFTADGAPTPPTNNRGELLGICYCLLAMLRGYAIGRTELISDSKNCVQTLAEWLPNRRRKGTAHELKNFDLIQIAETLLNLLRAQAICVVLTHVHSHKTAPPVTAPTRDRFVHLGNDKADKHAAAVLAKETVGGYPAELLDAPAVLQADALVRGVAPTPKSS